MKPLHPELLVHLDDKLSRVLAHWAAVDEVLPPLFPLVLLDNLSRAASQQLLADLPARREAEIARAQEVKLARGRYELRKRELHQWVKAFILWLCGNFQGTDWRLLKPVLPGRKAAYQHWWDVAHDSIWLWKEIEAKADVVGDWREFLPCGGPVERFEEALRGFEAAYRALAEAELEFRMARGARQRVENRGAALLVAYGHGVRARLAEKNLARENIPQLWPAHRKQKI